MEYTPLLVLVSVLYSCNNGNTTNGKIIEQKTEQKEVLKGLKEQLYEEFGEYTEIVKPEDREYYKAYENTLTLWKLPFHELNIKTQFGNAHVIVTGPKNADPLVLLHGMNASSTMWYPNIIALSQNHRVYAIDYLLEPGKSQMNRRVKDMDDIMEWYDRIFDELKLEKFTIIGASHGGWQAIWIALHHKPRIKKLVLLSPAQAFIWINPGSEILSDMTYTMDPKRKKLRGVLASMSNNVDSIKQPYIDQYFIATQKAVFSRFTLRMTPFYDNELRTLNMPVLLLIGDDDIINNKKSIEKAKRLIPNVETGIIKNSGHFLNMDQSEIVNKRMLDFLNANDTLPNKAGIVN